MKRLLTHNHKQKKELFDSVLADIYSKKSSEWKKISEKQLLKTFSKTMREVEAYQTFVTQSGKNPKTIKTISEFATVPPVTKKNYLRAFPWNSLCKKGALVHDSLVMTSTSGSTGAPFYFPRTSSIDLQSAVSHQLFLNSSKVHNKKSTLVINCFGMGVWIGGLLTYQAFKHITEHGYSFTIITPGISKNEIFQTFKNLAPHFDQIILCGYPPFVKDVIDEGAEAGIAWKDFDLKIIFAAEGFSETFRDYITEAVGVKDIYRDIMNVYGSADLGTMAQESPLCVLIRRLATTNTILYEKLFDQALRLPTLAQYIPDFINFESVNGSIYCTGDNVLPLVRYEIGDSGGVYTYDEMRAIFKNVGVDLDVEITLAGIKDTITELPFVYVYERSDFSASFYGAIIYPEFIKKGLLSKYLSQYVTGKFTMFTKNDENEDQYLEINVELKSNVKMTSSVRKKTLQIIYEALLSQSTEYTRLSLHLGDRIYPKIIFWPRGHELYFRAAGKQKWVNK
jgi:phenylacetate-CoA ligase